MLSRVAESLFWLERYRERAENTARYVDVSMHLNLDMPYNVNEQWLPLIETTGDKDLFLNKYGTPSSENVLEFLTFDEENPNSILSCLTKARESARSIQEIISSEMWHEINTVYLFIKDLSKKKKTKTPNFHLYNRVKRQCQLFSGIAGSGMSRNEAWHFGLIGSLLERADNTSRILDVKYYLLLPSPEDVGTPYDNIQWCALLHSASAFEMYRKKWHQVSNKNVIDFLVLSHEFPRSIYYCISNAEKSLHKITGVPMEYYDKTSEKLIGQLRSELSYMSAQDILLNGFHDYIDLIQIRINEINNQLTSDFFKLHEAKIFT